MGFISPLTSFFTIFAGILAIGGFLLLPIQIELKILVGFGTIAGVVFIVIAYSRNQKPKTIRDIPEEPVSDDLVMRTSDREGIEGNPDPEFAHISAVLFFPKNIPRKDRVPSKYLPRRAIMNWSTKKAYYMNTFSDNMLLDRNIDWTTREWINEDDFSSFFEKQGFELIRKPANLEDLKKVVLHEEDKAESSGGSMSWSLSEFSLITDKLTYKVGDTIRVSVIVRSLNLGTTVVRLITPTGEQFAFDTKASHFSNAPSFEFGVVEQSWPKGIWKIIAERGKDLAEKKIEIL